MPALVDVFHVNRASDASPSISNAFASPGRNDGNAVQHRRGEHVAGDTAEQVEMNMARCHHAVSPNKCRTSLSVKWQKFIIAAEAKRARLPHHGDIGLSGEVRQARGGYVDILQAQGVADTHQPEVVGGD